MITLTEAERRQQYLDKMTGKADGLRKMVEQCLNDDPDERPPIKEVSTIIEPLKVKIALNNIFYTYTLGVEMDMYILYGTKVYHLCFVFKMVTDYL